MPRRLKLPLLRYIEGRSQHWWGGRGGLTRSESACYVSVFVRWEAFRWSWSSAEKAGCSTS